jgi:hypothetical protein
MNLPRCRRSRAVGRIPPTRPKSTKIHGFHPKNTGFTLFIYSLYLIRLLAPDFFGPLGETGRQEKESKEKNITEGEALGSKTGHNRQMADEKSGRYDCLPESTRSTDDFQRLLLQALHHEQEGRSERPSERRLL